MARRRYDQYCGLAGALDLVGERWTLLVVRELMIGPKRYTDLADSLPGIGTSLLASRLKGLEESGICRRTYLPPPAASTVYELTDVGADLGHALMPLIRWGLRHAVPERPGPDTRIGPEWPLLGLLYDVDEESWDDIDATYRIDVEGRSAHLQVSDGRASVLPGDDDRPADATITLDAATVAAIGSGRISALDAASSGRIAFEGDQLAIERLVQAVG